MAQNTTKVSKGSKKTKVQDKLGLAMSERELAKLGGGEVAYIKILTSSEAKQMFPAITGLPKGISLFSLHAADGTPLALTDTKQAALGHAMEDELMIASLH